MQNLKRMMWPQKSEEDVDDLSLISQSSRSVSTNVTSTTDKPDANAPDARGRELAQQETKLVKRSKCLVLFVLLAAAAGCGAATYLFTANGEEENFREQVAGFGDEILEVSAITAANILSTVAGLSTTVTSYALDKNLTFPYVTIPHFDKRGDGFLELAGAQWILLCQIIEEDRRSEWESWSVQNQWIPEAYRPVGVPPNASLIVPFIFELTATGGTQPVESKPDQTLYPVWQLAPTIPGGVNLDVKNVVPDLASSLAKLEAGEPVAFLAPLEEKVVGDTVQLDLGDPATWPTTFLVAPINDNFDGKGTLVAFISSVIPWHHFFEKILPDDTKGMYVIIRSTCGASLTYQVNGPSVQFLGYGDLYDPVFDHLELIGAFDSGEYSSYNQDEADCDFTIHAYPTKELYDSMMSMKPIYFTLAVVFIFILTSIVFVLYDCLVQKRQETVMTSAQQSNALVSSLFPAQVRDRLMGEGEEDRFHTFSHGSKGSGNMAANLLGTKPIADLFPNVTVMFADISGFTQWSSEREPSQVFTLLEQIYNSFDAIAKKKRIFKVETIGDCYVAAAGLPEPRKDHAVAMARFAHDCRSKMNSVVKKLEVLLGPDTADLTMRFGLHSGPVTAGVLRGEKSRFQLFGDTVNTAARMESTGARNKIHISQATADLLLKADKGSWVKERESMVSAKGKGLMQTYWLSLKDTSLEPVCNASKTTATWSSVHSTDFCSHPHAQENGNEEMVPSDDRTQRLIEWNVDVLQRQLKKTIAMRNASTKKSNRKPSEVVEVKLPDGSMVLDEVKEVIPLSTESKTYRQNPEDIQLSVAVLIQLRDYVSAIAGMYKDNPFHNFAHASHVTQSVTKLLSRVVTPESIDYKDMCYKKQAGANDLHEYTYGITSDPLIQFACAFSALIHDVDHTGLPNAQLVKENSEIAKIYKNKSVAEQNSVDIAWGLLMEPSYGELRNCIYQTQEELERFRQLIVNAVMATDIADKEQAVFRKKRWAKAFNQEEGLESMAETSKEAVNRKATIVIEHLIQASDVSHTMQHWHVYLKWNERLFHEMYNAYLEGRAENDPSETWYQGELGFYDFYIIPLAKKLKDCGVFGVASDEYLDYATANRTEWELKGKEIVQGYLTLYKKNESGSNLGLATKESSVVEELVLPVPLSMAAKESSLVEELVLPLPIEIE